MFNRALQIFDHIHSMYELRSRAKVKKKKKKSIEQTRLQSDDALDEDEENEETGDVIKAL